MAELPVIDGDQPAAIGPSPATTADPCNTVTCAQNDIDHRLTKPHHPWTNGQVERINRTLKEATVKRFYYDTHDQLRRHLAEFVAAYNFAKRLKTRNGLTHCEVICTVWTKEPERFRLDPLHQMPGLNS